VGNVVVKATEIGGRQRCVEGQQCSVHGPTYLRKEDYLVYVLAHFLMPSRAHSTHNPLSVIDQVTDKADYPRYMMISRYLKSASRSDQWGPRKTPT
jgi:hypothetical protein